MILLHVNSGSDRSYVTEFWFTEDGGTNVHWHASNGNAGDLGDGNSEVVAEIGNCELIEGSADSAGTKTDSIFNDDFGLRLKVDVTDQSCMLMFK